MVGKGNDALGVDHVFDVKGLVAVVTGGATGIGLMCTQALATNGCKVYIIGRRNEVLQKTVELYSEKDGTGAEIVAIQGDVGDKAELQRIVKEIESKEPNGIHLLVNNAGIARDRTRFKQAPDLDHSDVKAMQSFLWQAEFQEWTETYHTNVSAMYFTSIAFMHLLDKARVATKGYTPSIVNITSISGLMKASSAGQFAYGTSKAAAIQLTRAMAKEFVDLKIRVNTIAPGVFPSEMTAGESDESNKSELPGFGGSLPAKRAGDEKDMAGCILFLASRAAMFCNGQILWPDGGNLLTIPSTI